ncbi:anti sigma factor C-terminal domain-containing protein [Heyndrickxia sp. FSL K6-6286]|uniref:anti sigma factor C-terminal domain-containing protein n=1 Tax=Heyndrickxia sp. FSL K6-6286 TaxID=2921510 RepID=UPI00315A9567
MNKENEFLPKDLEFEKLVKKAKRRSMTKMVLISLIISLIVFTGLYLMGDKIMNMKIENEFIMDSTWNEILGANVEEVKGTTYNYSPISATAKTKLVKKVGGVPIPWGEKERVFTILGTSRLITDVPPRSGSIRDERIPLYYQGERVIEFYHPDVIYKEIFDDRDLLNQIDDNKVVEMAFSFNKGYSIEEVEKIFKDQLAWYWVDTYSKKDTKEYSKLNEENSSGYTINGFEAYGFKYNNRSASTFISNLQLIRSKSGEYQEEATEIYNNITNNGRDKLTPKNLKIIGVVVTGKPSDLKKYNDTSIIRGAMLGATTDQY